MTPLKICLPAVPKRNFICEGGAMAHYNCIMIDLDNTLLDFDKAENQALEKTFAQFEFPDTPENRAVYKQLNSQLWQELEKGKIKRDALAVVRWKKFLAHLGRLGNAGKINEFYMNCLSQGCSPLHGALEFLEAVEDYATIAIITNGSEKVQKNRLAYSGVAAFVDGIFISERMGIHKPDKRFVNLALERLGVTNRQKVLVIGDSLTADIKCGVDAGLATCWCNFKGQENTLNLQPTYTVQGFEELKRVILTQEELENDGTEKAHKIKA